MIWVKEYPTSFGDEKSVKNLDELLSSSADLESILSAFFKLKTYDSTDRIRASYIMCSVAFEHAESAKMLLAVGNFTSAMGLLRL